MLPFLGGFGRSCFFPFFLATLVLLLLLFVHQICLPLMLAALFLSNLFAFAAFCSLFIKSFCLFCQPHFYPFYLSLWSNIYPNQPHLPLYNIGNSLNCYQRPESFNLLMSCKAQKTRGQVTTTRTTSFKGVFFAFVGFFFFLAPVGVVARESAATDNRDHI